MEAFILEIALDLHMIGITGCAGITIVKALPNTSFEAEHAVTSSGPKWIPRFGPRLYTLPTLRSALWICRQVPKSCPGFGHFQPPAVLEHGTEVWGREGVAEDAARFEGCGRQAPDQHLQCGHPVGHVPGRGFHGLSNHRFASHGFAIQPSSTPSFIVE